MGIITIRNANDYRCTRLRFFSTKTEGILLNPILMSAILSAALAAPLVARADTPEFVIVIENHRFAPAEVTVPAGQRVKLVIDNRDKTPEEFESHDLKREKVIAGGTKANIFVGPLKPGTYAFAGEYHEDTAQGKLIAK
jgi:plastocyanin